MLRTTWSISTGVIDGKIGKLTSRGQSFVAVARCCGFHPSFSE
jgi:hypothetical protein